MLSAGAVVVSAQTETAPEAVNSDHDEHHHHEKAVSSSGLPMIEELPWTVRDQELFARFQKSLIPQSKETATRLGHLLKGHHPGKTPVPEAIQKILDPLCLASVTINPESRVKVAAGPASNVLKTDEWNTFLIRVHNEAGVTAPLRCLSPNVITENEPNNFQRWAELEMIGLPLLEEGLSGRTLEYRILRMRTSETGKREARLIFDVGQGTQDLGFRSNVDLLFQCHPAHSPEQE